VLERLSPPRLPHAQIPVNSDPQPVEGDPAQYNTAVNDGRARLVRTAHKLELAHSATQQHPLQYTIACCRVYLIHACTTAHTFPNIMPNHTNFTTLTN
jgi:hypothetical protein